MNQSAFLKENLSYWTKRAEGYSKVNQKELETQQRCVWQNTLCQELRAHFPERDHDTIRVLDIGCGPGFFSIVLAEQGYQVTAVDLTRAMLDEAKRNAGHLADHIHFLEMDAQHLIFSDASFDAIVTRNLTWNLPDPKRAYEEWVRVLKPDGILLNFDANWYHYLFDDTAREGYLQDRNNTKEQGIEDENVGDGFDVMENIAARVPLSRIQRPQWDREVLEGLGVQVTLNEHIWNDVWSEEERINFSSTPMFLICAKKVIN